MTKQRSQLAIQDAQVVFLVNFLSPNLVQVMQEIADRVGRLVVLVSVPMEANRHFTVQNHGLEVICQRTITRCKLARHPGGYTEELYVHLPMDTWSQLAHLRPDCIVSLEMGMRSLLSSLYRRHWQRSARHVLAVYGSQRSEEGRGRLRTSLRRWLLRRADILTYNGPSCQRYLQGLGADSRRMLPWNYAADPSKIYRGAITEMAAPADNHTLKLLTVSQLIPRKGIDRAIEQLSRWALEQPELRLQWAIAGTGFQSASLQQLTLPANLQIEWLGNCDAEQLKTLYVNYPVHFFPTLGDEWGLVVDEALASGQIVLGSVYSQAVETLIEPGRNGWSYNPDAPETLAAALAELAHTTAPQLTQMRHQARESAESRTPAISAQQFVAAVSAALDV